MDPNVQYLAEEIAENHAEGLLPRREALRRLGFLGFSAAAGSALLAACSSSDDDVETGAQPTGTTTAGAGGTATTAPSGPTTTAAPVTTEDITFQGNGITIFATVGRAATPRGAVLVIHENQGLTPFVKSIAGRLGGSGYTALAIDLLSAQGGTSTFTDPAAIGPALTNNATERSVGDMKAGLEELQRRAPGVKLAAIGFCFGGGMVWELLRAGDPPALSAAIPFYGSSNNPEFSKTKAAVLAVYGETDTRINANQDLVRTAMQRANITHELRTFPGVGHAFVRNIDSPDSGNAFTQATAAYGAMIDWFGRHLR